MNTIFGATFVGRWFVEVFCSVRFAHTAHASLMGAYAPKRSANRALSREDKGRAITYEQLFICQTHIERLQSLIFATNGAIERFEFAP